MQFAEDIIIRNVVSLNDKNKMVGGCDNYSLVVSVSLVILVCVALYFAYSFYTKAPQTNTQPELSNQIIQQQNQPQELQQIKVNINNAQERPINFLRDYDYRTLYDPLVAPRRRDDYNLPVLPLPTRGYPSAFKKMGILIDKNASNDDKYKILVLMGRNTFPNSSVYEYYVTENSKDSVLKFDIDKTREIQTDDKIKVNELDKDYTVVLDKTLGYQYDPYLY